ncbi:MAG: branched-chain amino acid ABC transporter permease, partial [Deltaproteobacteria bacterium]|nr:branched-chain amino acid ABC transporter permease [Deltaproteobacteria bacterium]
MPRHNNTLTGSVLLILPLLLLAVVAYFFLTESNQAITTNLFINLIAVLGIYIFIGTSGVPSFGHVAFMGIAAHLQALLTLDPDMKALLLPNLPAWLGQLQLSLWPAMLVTVVFVGLFALLIGIPFSRMGDAATGIVTLCFLVIVHNVLNGWETFTAGVKVLYGIPEYCGLWTAFGLAMVMIFIARFFRGSVSGLELRASREDKEAAQSIGVNVPNQRLLAWVLSAMVMAVAGVLLVHFLTIVNPLQFYLALTFSLIAMLIVGGLSTVSGAVIGTLFMTVVIEILRRIGEGPTIGFFKLPQLHGLTMIGTGAAIIVVMFWKRDGIIAFFEIDERIANLRNRRAAERRAQNPVFSERSL